MDFANYYIFNDQLHSLFVTVITKMLQSIKNNIPTEVKDYFN